MKIKFYKYLIVVVLLFNINSYCQSGEEIENTFLNMRKYLVSIGTVLYDSSIIKNGLIAKKIFVPIGSGLLTYIKYDTLTLTSVITASHVIQFFKENNLSSIFIRPSWADTIETTDYLGVEIPLTNSDKTPNIFLYPEDNVDIGCILILPNYYNDVYIRNINKEIPKTFPYNSMTAPYLGDQVWICGYPGHIEDQTEKKFRYIISTFKPGYVAWKPNANMINRDLNHITIVESNATYGNSGGPVFALHNQIELVGIMVAGYDEIDSVYLNNKVVFDPIFKQPFVTKRRAGVSIIENAVYVKKMVLFVESVIRKFHWK